MKAGINTSDIAVPERGSSKRPPHVVIILFIVLLFIIIGLVGLYLLGASNKREKRGVITPTPMPSATPVLTSSASPSASMSPTISSLDKSALHVSVLNGSGIRGAANGISTYLSHLGYSVVSVGNADSYEYRNITVLVKTDKSSYAQLLKKDLENNSGSVSSSLSDEISSDAEVIVGR